MQSFDYEEVRDLRRRIKELEEKVEGLRMSRRILMNILDLLEKTKREEISRLEAENYRLQKSNQRYAKAILQRNIELQSLQRQQPNPSPREQSLVECRSKTASGTE